MDKIIKLETQSEAQDLFGLHDENIKTLEKDFKVKITLRDGHLKISGPVLSIKKAESFIYQLLGRVRQGQAVFEKKEKSIGPRSDGQREYVEAIKSNDIVFGMGPAGTGKTYLAMASAVESLKKQEVRRIILTRPAIEAGESLGYLPGDMYEKISPYLRPLYDALYDMMEAEVIEKYLENSIIEVAPLAYMRGRTLNDAFIVMDEAQNATAEQMKMFLTRLGFDSKAVITGDITQSDLPGARPIGLLQAQEILKDIEGIKFVYLTGADVVRHALVQKIIEAYDKTAAK